MKILIVLTLVASVYASIIPSQEGGLVGVIKEQLIPLGEKIRQAEEQSLSQRIVGGQPSQLGAFPYQAGLLFNYVGTTGIGVCGGSLVSSTSVISAAHCWFDGSNQGARVTIVLGSTTLFQGGIRIETSNVIQHPNWTPLFVRNDINVIVFDEISFTENIAPIALPSGDELDEDFVGAVAVASGFGVNDEGSLTTNQFLSHVNVQVISNTECRSYYPFIYQNTNICTSGAGGVGTCSGDSGGPLAVNSNGRRILIGVTSFGSAAGCNRGHPHAYARVTTFIDFINQNI